MIIGLVLAGGLSSRMGRDKASLLLDGRSLLWRACDALRDAGAELVALSGDRPGGIPDAWPRRGPVGGLASAAAVLPDGQLLVVPVDMPWVDAGALLPLLADRSQASTCWQGHPLPMRMTLDDAARAALAWLMTQPPRDCSVSALQSRLGVAALPLDGIHTRQLINCNTPDEWREANP